MEIDIIFDLLFVDVMKGYLHMKNCNNCIWCIITKPSGLYRICSNPKSNRFNSVYTPDEVEKFECEDICVSTQT